MLACNAGVMKRGRGMCGVFQAFNLMYLHILRAGMVYITLWYMHVPRTEQTWYMHVPRYVLGLNMLTLLHAGTNAPLTSARLPTSFQQPL